MPVALVSGMNTKNVCGHCGGECYVEDPETREYGLFTREACYHCGGTGKVDDETLRNDALMDVAYSLAYSLECECRQYMNSDPDGDGYDFGAAERWMTPHDYFQSRVQDRVEQVSKDLFNLSDEVQDVLIAWHAEPRGGKMTIGLPVPEPKPELTDWDTAHLYMARDMQDSDCVMF